VLLRLALRARLNLESSAHPLELAVLHARAGDEPREVARLGAGAYRGEALWVGCGPGCDVEVPARQIELWKAQLGTAEPAASEWLRWAVPDSLGDQITLEAGDRLEARLVRRDGGIYVRASLMVAPAAPRGLVQTLLLDPDATPEQPSDAHAGAAGEAGRDGAAVASEPGDPP
jgi:hypothetical protein